MMGSSGFIPDPCLPFPANPAVFLPEEPTILANRLGARNAIRGQGDGPAGPKSRTPGGQFPRP